MADSDLSFVLFSLYRTGAVLERLYRLLEKRVEFESELES